MTNGPTENGVAVEAAEDFNSGERRIVEMNGKEVDVFNIKGEYFAIVNYCPHRGGPICEGDTIDTLVGEWPGPGERTHEEYKGEPSVTCPWHGWEFDLRTGDHCGDDEITVQTYTAYEMDGTVYIGK